MRAGKILWLYLVVFLLLVISSFGSSAQPSGTVSWTQFCNSDVDHNKSCLIEMLAAIDDSDGPVDVSIQSWRGIAVEDNKSRSLRLIIENIKSINPCEARNLLASNASIEEIKSRIRTPNRAVSVRGNLRLDNEIYRLINIIVTSSGNKSILEADVLGPIASPEKMSTNDVKAIAGNITLTLSMIDGKEVGEGSLNLNDIEHIDIYKILICSFPCRGLMASYASSVKTTIKE